MAIKKLKSIKGRVVRITRLDECGSPVFGACSVVVAKCFAKVTITGEYEDGDEYTAKNAWGELDINEKDPGILKMVGVSITLNEIDPSVLDIIGGASPVVFGSDTIGATFGPAAPTGSYAVEVWTKKVGGACAAGTPEWGYFVVGFVKNGKIDGDLTIENAPLSLTLTGEGYGCSADWGVGPHADYPMKNNIGLPAGEYWGMVVTDVQPPDVTDGCVALVAPPSKGAVEPGDVFPGEPTITAESAPMAALLAGLGFVVAPTEVAAWGTGEFFSVGAYRFNWTGAAWAAGPHA